MVTRLESTIFELHVQKLYLCLGYLHLLMREYDAMFLDYVNNLGEKVAVRCPILTIK